LEKEYLMFGLFKSRKKKKKAPKGVGGPVSGSAHRTTRGGPSLLMNAILEDTALLQDDEGRTLEKSAASMPEESGPASTDTSRDRGAMDSDPSPEDNSPIESGSSSSHDSGSSSGYDSGSSSSYDSGSSSFDGGGGFGGGGGFDGGGGF
jgi:hypothetical protein